MLEKPEQRNHIKPMNPEENIDRNCVWCVFMSHCIGYVKEDEDELVLKKKNIEKIQIYDKIQQSKSKTQDGRNINSKRLK